MLCGLGPAPLVCGVAGMVTSDSLALAAASAFSVTLTVALSGPLNDVGSAGVIVTPDGTPEASNLIGPEDWLKRLSSSLTVVEWPAATSTRSALSKMSYCGTIENSGGGGVDGLS